MNIPSPLRGRPATGLPGLLMLAATAVAVALAAIPAALAANAIQHCIDADGTPIYTDRSCAALDAAPVPMPADMLRRIASEQARHAFKDGEGFDDTMRPASAAITRRSTASGCARSATQLSMDLQASWAMGDVNRVAESYHWVGMTHRQGQQVMQRLDRLSMQPLQRAEYFNAQIGGAGLQLADAGGTSGGGAGIMQVTYGDSSAPGVQDFDVRRYRGCYFVEFR